jgi:hypothetical protein
MMSFFTAACWVWKVRILLPRIVASVAARKNKRPRRAQAAGPWR